jgi:hypothetical protein
MKKAKVLSLSLILLFFVLSTVASAGYSVAEPTAILLLGAGLVSLAVYAKKKRSKKQ